MNAAVDLCALFLLPAQHVSLPEGLTANLQILLRWVHLIAGITWLGLLYFFNLVNIPFMNEIEGPVRSRVIVTLIPRALWWFRWAAVVTVIAGLWYWMMIVGADARNAQASGLTAITSFFLIWTAVFALEMALLMAPVEGLRKGGILGVVVGIAVVAAGCLYVKINSHGWESNRLLAIGVGGGLGWFMLLNVWGIIWRAQKRIIRWTKENAASGAAMPSETPKLARLVFLLSRLNFALSFPMLFFMAAASHYPLFTGAGM